MGISTRNNDILDKLTRMQCADEDYTDGHIGNRSAIQCGAFG